MTMDPRIRSLINKVWSSDEANALLDTKSTLDRWVPPQTVRLSEWKLNLAATTQTHYEDNAKALADFYTKVHAASLVGPVDAWLDYRGKLLFDPSQFGNQGTYTPGSSAKYMMLNGDNITLRGLGRGVTIMECPIDWVAASGKPNLLLQFGFYNTNLVMADFSFGFTNALPTASTRSGGTMFQSFGCTYLTIRDVEAYGSRDLSFSTPRARWFVYQRVLVRNSHNDGFQISNSPSVVGGGEVLQTSQYGVITDCQFDSVGDDCIALAGYYRNNGADYQLQPNNIIINNCHFFNGVANSLIDVYGWDGVDIGNCTFEGFKDRAVFISRFHLGGGYPSKRVRVHDNLFRKLSTSVASTGVNGSGVVSIGDANTATFSGSNAIQSGVPEVENIEVYNNTIQAYDTPGILIGGRASTRLASANAEYDPLGTMKNVTVRDNWIEYVGPTAVSAWHAFHSNNGSSRNLSILNNKFVNWPGRQISANNYLADGANGGLRIEGNEFIDVQGNFTDCAVYRVGLTSSVDQPNVLRSIINNKVRVKSGGTHDRIWNLPTAGANPGGTFFHLYGNTLSLNGGTVTNTDILTAVPALLAASGDANPSIADASEVLVHAATTSMDGLDDMQVGQTTQMRFAAGVCVLTIATSGANKFVDSFAASYTPATGDILTVKKIYDGTLRILGGSGALRASKGLTVRAVTTNASLTTADFGTLITLASATVQTLTLSATGAVTGDAGRSVPILNLGPADWTIADNTTDGINLSTLHSFTIPANSRAVIYFKATSAPKWMAEIPKIPRGLTFTGSAGVGPVSITPEYPGQFDVKASPAETWWANGSTSSDWIGPIVNQAAVTDGTLGHDATGASIERTPTQEYTLVRKATTLHSYPQIKGTNRVDIITNADNPGQIVSVNTKNRTVTGRTYQVIVTHTGVDTPVHFTVGATTPAVTTTRTTATSDSANTWAIGDDVYMVGGNTDIDASTDVAYKWT